LEDKATGGTVKISVLPEPTPHDIEELDKQLQQNLSNNSQQIGNTKNGNGPSPIITSPTSPTISTFTENNTQQISLVNSASPTSALQQIPPTTNTIATETTGDNTRRNDEQNKQKLNGTTEPHGIQGHQEYKLNSNIEYSRLLVEYQGQQHQLWHIRCGGWKDQDAPDLDLFMDLWHLVQEKLKSHKVSSGEKHKIVIHCTGGVGRTGTFIAVDIAGQELKEKQKEGKWDEFSIEKVIHFLRKKRMNMVGSVSQYIFCHRAALNLFNSSGGALEANKGPPLESSLPPVVALT